MRVLAQHFAELIPDVRSVLDVGCGDGQIDRLILRRRPNLHLEGVDVLVRSNAHIPVTWFDGKRLPFADRSWDTVILCDVLHHTENPAAMLGEAVRVAMNSVVIKDHIVQGLFGRAILRFMDFVGNAPHGVTLPYNYLTQSEWDATFKFSGLVLEDIRRDLRLYPPVADLLFGRALHFIARCTMHAR